MQGLQKFLARWLLAVNAWNFLDPADLPICVLLYYRSISLLHFCTSDTSEYTESHSEQHVGWAGLISPTASCGSIYMDQHDRHCWADESSPTYALTLISLS